MTRNILFFHVKIVMNVPLAAKSSNVLLIYHLTTTTTTKILAKYTLIMIQTTEN